MSDRIELRGLAVLALCGALPEERVRRQPFVVDVDVFCDLRAACATDDLDDTVNYGLLCEQVDDIARDEQFTLLERFAQRVADVLMADARISAVTVSVRKMRPPVPQQLDTSGVRIHRER